MAAKFPSAGGIKLKPRKGHDLTWSCDKHAEPISFYCKDHNIPLCHKCATIDHQKPCKLQDIEDVILEMGTKIDEKWLELDEMSQRLKRLNSKIQSCSIFVSNHLENVNAEVNIAYEGKIKCVETKKQEDILQINKEADEEIKIINERRERRIESRIMEAEKQHRTLKETLDKILSESKEINVTVGKKMADLKNKNQHSVDTIANVDLKIKRIRKEDKTLVSEAHQVITSLDENVRPKDIDACLVQIQSEVERVKFVEGEMGGKQFSRIDGYKGTWEIAKSFLLPSTLKSPVVCGLISDDELCVRDDGNNDDLYVSNIIYGHTNKAIKGESDMYVTSCAPIGNDLIVCGKWRRDCKGDSLDGCITIYDRQWKMVRDIAIPKNASSYYNDVYVDVDKDGKILSAQRGQSNVYVVNPADGKTVNTFVIQGKMVDGEIQALSSGDVVVKTGCNEFTFISRSGEEKAAQQHDEWGSPSCHVDKLTDTLYITYSDSGRGIRAVDQVSRDGNIHSRSIVEYNCCDTHCLMTPSGNLTVCDGDNICVYKKTFHV